jgi:hypothetical protein
MTLWGDRRDDGHSDRWEEFTASQGALLQTEAG